MARDDDLFDEDDDSLLAETWRYTRELKRLLARDDLAPDTRARCVASLLDSTTAAQFEASVQTLVGDGFEPFVSTVEAVAAKPR